MARKPAEPPPSGQRSEIGQQAGPREQEGEREPRQERGRQDPRAEREEREGPVAIARHVKPDGRALIIYTRVTRPAA